VTTVSNPEQFVASLRDAAWLPPGGRADVVLAHDGNVPSPTCLVRLLVTRDRQVLTQRRRDGRGRDIPTRHVGDGDPQDVLLRLMLDVLGGAHPTSLLGYVRNVVPDASEDYPWPCPEAHFVVWHCSLPADSATAALTAAGSGTTWLTPAEATTQLGERHWWPLAAHLRL
jgi:hypothetical protein